MAKCPSAGTLFILGPSSSFLHIIPVRNLLCLARECHGCQVYWFFIFSSRNAHYLNISFLSQKQISQSGQNPAGNFNPGGKYAVFYLF